MLKKAYPKKWWNKGILAAVFQMIQYLFGRVCNFFLGTPSLCLNYQHLGEDKHEKQQFINTNRPHCIAT